MEMKFIIDREMVQWFLDVGLLILRGFVGSELVSKTWRRSNSKKVYILMMGH